MAYAIVRAVRGLERRLWHAQRHVDVQPEQVQGLLVHGFDALECATCLGVSFTDKRRAGAWLLANPPAHALEAEASAAMNLAFTYRWFQRLGLPAETLAAFDASFQEGMSEPERARRLGDSGDAAPACWEWGGSSNPPFDLTLLFYARDRSTLAKVRARALRDVADHAGEVVFEIATELLPGRKEHFGFRGGIAQPIIENRVRAAQRVGLLRRGASHNTVAPGEFILGYTNGFDALPSAPSLPAALDANGVLPGVRGQPAFRDLGRNGSYLVLRQLRQDVLGFWSAFDRLAPDPAARELLAAKAVGRWRSGAPLVLAPRHDVPTLADADAFGYAASDPEGLRCPFGSHIRRANPRDWQLARVATRASAMSNQHRLVRRSRPYGPPLAASLEPKDFLATPEDGVDRGLLFMAFNADLSRQYELVQEAWLNNPCFGRLRGESDPLLGRVDSQRWFTVPQRPFAQRYAGIPSAVTMRGGAYLFLPSLAAVRCLGKLAQL